MKVERASGILLHPTSLPGPYGIGEFGLEAMRFLEWLSSAGQRLWQVLPLGPVGHGNSPYQSYSAFAGNPLLVSLERLLEDGLLEASDLADAPEFPADRVDYDAVSRFKLRALRIAHSRFKPNAAYRRFRQQQSVWLEDYALFIALRDGHEGVSWREWEPELAARKPQAIERARKDLRREIDFHRFMQHLFWQHYGDVKREANKRGIRIVGDLPIFVAYDSADVWTHRDMFHLDDEGSPTVVAGVPPDYFSEDGQLWGNPLYRWDYMARDGYAWWAERIGMSLTLYDVVRIDHFRGFAAYWEVPAGEKTARNGRWVKGPGARFFQRLREEFGELPIIAEDLGTITPDVHALRDRFDLPGMKVLQFAFSGPDNAYLPHNHHPNYVVYTGTHDNDTTRGWWRHASKEEKAFARRYLDRSGRDIAWGLIRVALGSVARLAVFPLQDVLDLGSKARMNRPGTMTGNWAWRYSADALTPALRDRLRELTSLYERAGAEDDNPASKS